MRSGWIRPIIYGFFLTSSLFSVYGSYQVSCTAKLSTGDKFPSIGHGYSYEFAKENACTMAMLKCQAYLETKRFYTSHCIIL